MGQQDVEPCVLQPLLTQLDQAVSDQNTIHPGLNLTKSQVKVELFATAGMRTENERNGGSHTNEQIVQYYEQMKAYVAQWGYAVGEFKTINGHSFYVYCKSFLGLGGDDARKYVKAYNYNSNNGGTVCYANGATPINTREKSGIQLYPSDQVLSGAYPFPSNSEYQGTPWTAVPDDSLLLQVAADYNGADCSNLYETTVNQVTSLLRNKYGTFNDGDIATMHSFKDAIATSLAAFVGTDNFFYTAKDLGLAFATDFDVSTFQNNLQTYCSSLVEGGVNAQNVCPNGNFMNTYLFGPSGLFRGNEGNFVGVVDPKDRDGHTVLTWTRGYLLLKYAK